MPNILKWRVFVNNSYNSWFVGCDYSFYFIIMNPLKCHVFQDTKGHCIYLWSLVTQWFPNLSRVSHFVYHFATLFPPLGSVYDELPRTPLNLPMALAVPIRLMDETYTVRCVFPWTITILWMSDVMLRQFLGLMLSENWVRSKILLNLFDSVVGKVKKKPNICCLLSNIFCRVFNHRRRCEQHSLNS